MKLKKLTLCIGAAAVIAGAAVVVWPASENIAGESVAAVEQEESWVVQPMVITPEEQAEAQKKLAARGPVDFPVNDMLEAVSNGDKELVKLHIQAGTKLVYREEYENIVHYAVRSKDIEMTKLVLSIPGIRLHVHAPDIGEPIVLAAAENNKKAIKLILNHPDWKCPSAQLHAILTNDAAALKAIIEKGEFKPAGAELWTSEMAAALGHKECLELIVEAVKGNEDFGINEYGSYGPAIALAVRHGHVDCVKLLIAVPGINLNCESFWDDEAGKHITPLQYAISQGKTEIAEILRAAGAE